MTGLSGGGRESAEWAGESSASWGRLLKPDSTLEVPAGPTPRVSGSLGPERGLGKHVSTSLGAY